MKPSLLALLTLLTHTLSAYAQVIVDAKPDGGRFVEVDYTYKHHSTAPDHLDLIGDWRMSEVVPVAPNPLLKIYTSQSYFWADYNFKWQIHSFWRKFGWAPKDFQRHYLEAPGMRFIMLDQKNSVVGAYIKRSNQHGEDSAMKPVAIYNNQDALFLRTTVAVYRGSLTKKIEYWGSSVGPLTKTIYTGTEVYSLNDSKSFYAISERGPIKLNLYELWDADESCRINKKKTTLVCRVSKTLYDSARPFMGYRIFKKVRS